MAGCLGIYLDGNMAKYAKLSIDNNKLVNVEKYGIKFTSEGYSQVINRIIEETSSHDIPVVINPREDVYYNTQIYEQVQDKSYIPSIMKLEFESWCEKNAKSPDRFSYVYMVSETKNTENKRNAILNITPKDIINNDIDIAKNLSGISPAKPLVKRLVSDEESNYILINIDTELSITVVIDKKIVEFKSYSNGMRQLLDDFTSNLGSYEKAYNTCKQMNVYTEGESTNDPNLEQIVEPVFQEILKLCLVEVNKYKNNVSQIFLTGVGTAFTNVDLLFSQFLDMKCTMLKPFFIKDTSDVRYMSEIVEATEAIALAYEYLNPMYTELQYVAKKAKLNSKINKMFSASPKVNKSKKEKKENSVDNVLVTDKPLEVITYVTIVAIVIMFFYIAFGIVYQYSVDKTIKNLEEKKQNIIAETENVNSDISYINKNMKEYKDINDEVEDIKNKIESHQIGKFSTYNVASFLQNIIKIIPTNVRLINISSNDNKYVTITASSDEYEDLGYFFAQLKLESVLNNAKILKVNNGETTTVEIGGDLP